MKLLRNQGDFSVLALGAVAAIGNFDGVHRGHQALLTAVRTMASQLNLPMLVIVFEPQTREYFLKEQSPPRLTRLREKICLLRQFGVDYVCCLRFDRRMARMSAVAFAQSFIFSRLQVKHLIIGHDFRFGCDRLGDVQLLQTIGAQYNAQVVCYPDFLQDKHRVSSTLVRQALQSNRLDEAERLLGRVYALCGRVIYGDGLGRTWGVPTANLKLASGPLALHGVFCVEVLCQDGLRYQGVANMGRRPTLNGLKPLLEVHLLHFSRSLYGQNIEVFFLHKLRDEIKFSSKDALITQIHKDVAAAKSHFLE